VFCCSFFLLLPRAEAPTSVFLPSLLLFALLYCFCHLASLLLLPNGGSNMKVGSALLFWLLRWRCCGGGRWRCRGSRTAAPNSNAAVSSGGERGSSASPLLYFFLFFLSLFRLPVVVSLSSRFCFLKNFPSRFQASP
jgi:hypothetical protein